MPRSRNRQKQRHASSGRRRWDWRRAAGGWAELLRNIALVLFSAPFVEPLLSGTPVNWVRALVAFMFGLALVSCVYLGFRKARLMDDVTLYLALLGGFFVAAGGLVAFMAHREWDREARESDEASHTAAE